LVYRLKYDILSLGIMVLKMASGCNYEDIKHDLKNIIENWKDANIKKLLTYLLLHDSCDLDEFIEEVKKMKEKFDNITTLSLEINNKWVQ